MHREKIRLTIGVLCMYTSMVLQDISKFKMWEGSKGFRDEMKITGFNVFCATSQQLF